MGIDFEKNLKNCYFKACFAISHMRLNGIVAITSVLHSVGSATGPKFNPWFNHVSMHYGRGESVAFSSESFFLELFINLGS